MFKHVAGTAAHERIKNRLVAIMKDCLAGEKEATEEEVLGVIGLMAGYAISAVKPELRVSARAVVLFNMEKGLEVALDGK